MLSHEVALPFRGNLAVGAGLPDGGEQDRGRRPARVLWSSLPVPPERGQRRGRPFAGAHHRTERLASKRRRAVIDQQRDERVHGRQQCVDEPASARRAPARVDRGTPRVRRFAPTAGSDRATDPIRALNITRIHGNGCGSSRVTRNTKARGRLTTPISPIVDATPTRATDQKSATISEIQRSYICQATPSAPACLCFCRSSTRSDVDEVEQSAQPGDPLRERVTRRCRCRPFAPAVRESTATGLSPPPGRRVRARRIAAPVPRSM